VSDPARDRDSGDRDANSTTGGVGGSAPTSDVSRVGGGVRDSVAAGSTPVPPLWRAIAVYTGIRLGLVVALTAALWFAGRPFGMPPIVALAFAIVLQLPIAVVLFRGARSNLTAALARSKAKRTAERDRLHAQLTGEEPLD
jgi:hypothetical protein